MSNSRKIKTKDSDSRIIEIDETGSTVYHEIRLERGLNGKAPIAICGCGEFETEPDTNLLALGRAAKEHAEESGHILRRHP